MTISVVMTTLPLSVVRSSEILLANRPAFGCPPFSFNFDWILLEFWVKSNWSKRFPLAWARFLDICSSDPHIQCTCISVRVKSKAWMPLKYLNWFRQRKRFAFLKISAAEILGGLIHVDFRWNSRFTIILVWSLVDFEELCDTFSFCALWKPCSWALIPLNLIKSQWNARFLCKIE